jgi:colanic acid/amylovoran biosynthesis glycosyltransferase
MHILHLCHEFLPVTQNWVYSQLVFNKACRSTVLCRFRSNEDQFPHDAVFAAGRSRSCRTAIGLLSARITASYPARWPLHIINTVRPDLIHGHFATESFRYLAAIRRSGLPLVTTFYGVDISMLPLRPVWRKRYAELFESGAAFIVEGDFMAERLAGLGCPPGKIHCIPLGVDIGEFARLREQREPYPRPLRILHVGLGREKKGSIDAAEAFIAIAKRLKHIRLDIVGDGPFRAPVERRIQEAGLSDRCIFNSFLPVARYRELMGRSDILLAPSVRAESGDDEGGAPVTVIEAQAAAMAVCGTRHCDIPMVVENGETGLLVAEHDVTALADALEKLCTDDGLRNKMGAAGARRAAARHDIRKQVEKIAEVYKVCLETGR